jgi:cytoskeleton protein RodZ
MAARSGQLHIDPSDGTVQPEDGDVGNRLRRAREKMGVSLRDISARTKISISVLEALECSDIKRLPGGIFTRSFLRSYAAEVGLNPDETVREFIEQFPHESVTAGTPHSSYADDNEAIESDRRSAETVLKLLLVSVPVAGALLYFSITGRNGDRVVAESSPDVAAGGAAASATTAQIPVPEGSGVTEPPRPVAEGSPAPLVVAIKLKGPCWVSATVDGQRRTWRLMQAGEEQTFNPTSELVIIAGDAGVLDLIINGTVARPLGGRGEVITRRITPTNFRAYLP